MSLSCCWRCCCCGLAEWSESDKSGQWAVEWWSSSFALFLLLPCNYCHFVPPKVTSTVSITKLPTSCLMPNFNFKVMIEFSCPFGLSMGLTFWGKRRLWVWTHEGPRMEKPQVHVKPGPVNDVVGKKMLIFILFSIYIYWDGRHFILFSRYVLRW